MQSYFVVRHGLDSLTAMPDFIWNTSEPRSHMPRGYRQVKAGDRWIGFAFTTSDERERRLSLITGTLECTQKAWYGDVPRKAHPLWEGKAWMIKGKPRWQPSYPVVIPPIVTFLNNRLFNQATISRISRDEFEHIESYARRHEFHPKQIPLLGRAPQNEQELLAVVVSGHRRWGIEQILHIHKAFPDLLVRLKGRREPVHLELELASQGFCAHGHHKQVHNTRFDGDGRPVATLCWIDDERVPKRRNCVHRIYVLQDLIRQGKRIRW